MMVRIGLLTTVLAVLPTLGKGYSVVKGSTPSWVRWLQHHDMIKDGQAVIPFEEYCSVANSPACTEFHQIADSLQEAESALFCAHRICSNQLLPVYNSSTGLCQCPRLTENSYFPEIRCATTMTCEHPFAPYVDVVSMSCVCSIASVAAEGFPSFFEPNKFKEQYYGPNKHKADVPDFHDQIQLMQEGLKALRQPMKYLSPYSRDFHKRSSERRREHINRVNVRELAEHPHRVEKFNAMMEKRLINDIQPTTSGAVSLAPLSTYIPPAATQLTDEFIQESLLLQPQKIATVASVVPHFAEGVITFFVQLDGPVPETLTLNATDTIPCANIGTQPEPNLVVVPSTVKSGTAQVILPDCLVLAVNIYDPRYITYWIQKEDGSVHSLLGDSQVHAIDQLDTSRPASLAIRVATANNDTSKRDVDHNKSVAVLKRTQIFAVQCDSLCPFYHMEHIKASDGRCGCIFKDFNQQLELDTRAVEQPTAYTATMTAEACAAMTCRNNGGKPALFNPFTSTCWCAAPVFVEINDSAYSGGL